MIGREDAVVGKQSQEKEKEEGKVGDELVASG
jgi:hypothetical protein